MIAYCIFRKKQYSNNNSYIEGWIEMTEAKK